MREQGRMRITRTKRGKCTFCGREGIISWRCVNLRGPPPVPEGFILNSHGGGEYYCNDACFQKEKVRYRAKHEGAAAA